MYDLRPVARVSNSSRDVVSQRFLKVAAKLLNNFERFSCSPVKSPNLRCIHLSCSFRVTSLLLYWHWNHFVRCNQLTAKTSLETTGRQELLNEWIIESNSVSLVSYSVVWHGPPMKRRAVGDNSERIWSCWFSGSKMFVLYIQKNVVIDRRYMLRTHTNDMGVYGFSQQNAPLFKNPKEL